MKEIMELLDAEIKSVARKIIEANDSGDGLDKLRLEEMSVSLLRARLRLSDAANFTTGLSSKYL